MLGRDKFFVFWEFIRVKKMYAFFGGAFKIQVKYIMLSNLLNTIYVLGLSTLTLKTAGLKTTQRCVK